MDACEPLYMPPLAPTKKQVAQDALQRKTRLKQHLDTYGKRIMAEKDAFDAFVAGLPGETEALLTDCLVEHDLGGHWGFIVLRATENLEANKDVHIAFLSKARKQQVLDAVKPMLPSSMKAVIGTVTRGRVDYWAVLFRWSSVKAAERSTRLQHSRAKRAAKRRCAVQ